MSEISYSQIQDQLNTRDISSLPGLGISILRNVTLEPMEPYLRYFALQMGFKAKVEFGEYDNVFQEAVGEGKYLLGEGADIVLVFVKLDTLSPRIARNFASLKPQEIQAEVETVKDFISGVVCGIRSRTKAALLWNGFEQPSSPSRGILDSQEPQGQSGIVEELNNFAKRKLSEQGNAYFVNLNLCLMRLGKKKYFDLRYWHIGRAPYTREALKEIALENFKFIRALNGKNKKCLVLDCDNALWGGIIGEDGTEKIKLGKTYPGAAYCEFQNEAVNLYNRGIILALCSKNNEEDVWDVFRRHPDMVLKREQIASAQINWEDKATNLRRIALDLNIGLDSMVFSDDSAFEINLVRNLIPEVTCIHLPKEAPGTYADLLSSSGLFDSLVVSPEDRKRGSMYRAEGQRKDLKSRVEDLEKYYHSLEMVVEIRIADDFSIPRIAQLTQKTNQFNLTTKRYSEADIKGFVEGGDSDVITLKLADRFGDYGTVGVCILKYEEGVVLFDSFLLSCRVLGRGVEATFMAEVLKFTGGKGCKLAVGEFYATKKNGQAEFFFAKQGFQEKEPENGKADRTFYWDMDKESPGGPVHFKKVVSKL